MGSPESIWPKTGWSAMREECGSGCCSTRSSATAASFRHIMDSRRSVRAIERQLPEADFQATAARRFRPSADLADARSTRRPACSGRDRGARRDRSRPRGFPSRNRTAPIGLSLSAERSIGNSPVRIVDFFATMGCSENAGRTDCGNRIPGSITGLPKAALAGGSHSGAEAEVLVGALNDAMPRSRNRTQLPIISPPLCAEN